MNSAEIYKQKYLKYKMKYLSLQQKGGMDFNRLAQLYDGAKNRITQVLDRITSEEEKLICTTAEYIFDDCYLQRFNIPPNITKKQREEEIIKIKDIMLNSQKEKETENKIRKIKYNNGDIYSGLLEKGVPHGQGKMIYKNGDIYEGNFIESKPKGKIEVKSNKFAYFGEIENNIPNGHGEIIYSTGSKYTGYFIKGVPHGEGKMTYINGDIYQGNWDNGKKDKYGVYTYKESGDIYNGYWKDDEKNGKFEISNPSFFKSTYSEKFVDGIKQNKEYMKTNTNTSTSKSRVNASGRRVYGR